MIQVTRITELAHHLVEMVISEGDLAVDATAGNGHDTVFLAKKVGESGYVYSFDIQQEALDITYNKLKQENLEKRVTLVTGGHENLKDQVQGRAAVIMFNLGYLPGGNRWITTKYDTTIESLEQALTVLAPGGIITMVLYPGHQEGFEEKKQVIPFCRQLDPGQYAVLNSLLLNRGQNPPELVVIQRRSGGCLEV